MSVTSEAPQPVLECQFTFRKRTCGLGGRSARGRQSRDGGLRKTPLLQLLAQGAVLVAHNDPRDRLQKYAVFLWDLLEATNENTAGFFQHLRAKAGRNQPGDFVVQ